MGIEIKMINGKYMGRGWPTASKVFVGFTILVTFLIVLASPILIVLTFPIQTLIIYLVNRHARGIQTRMIHELVERDKQKQPLTDEQKEFEEFKKWKESRFTN